MIKGPKYDSDTRNLGLRNKLKNLEGSTTFRPRNLAVWIEYCEAFWRIGHIFSHSDLCENNQLFLVARWKLEIFN